MSAAAVPRQPVPGDRLRRPLRELMRPGVIVVGADASVITVRRALLAHGVHAVLVLEASGRPLGWATPAGVLAMSGRDG